MQRLARGVLTAAFALVVLPVARPALAVPPADDRREPQLQYIQQTVVTRDHGSFSTNPAPELVLGTEILGLMRFNAFFDLNEPGRENTPATILDRGMRLDTLSLEMKTRKDASEGVIEFGKLSPQRGYTWQQVVPGWRPLISGAQPSRSLMVFNQVGLRLDYNGDVSDRGNLRLNASLTRAFSGMDGAYTFFRRSGSVGVSARAGEEDGLTESWTPTIIGGAEYTHKRVAGGTLMAGLDGSYLAKGGAAASEIGAGGHAAWKRPLFPFLRFTAAGEGMQLVNAAGQPGVLSPVLSGTAMVEATFGARKGTWLSLHAAGSGGYADGTRLVAAEAGGAVKLIDTFRAVFAAERSYRFSGPYAGPATAIQIGGAFSPW